MRRFLLVDFGASRIKSGIADEKGEIVETLRNHPSLANVAKERGKFEADPQKLRELFDAICSTYANDPKTAFDAIFLSGEMHGFIAVNESHEPLTNYISWRDERSLHVINGESTFNYAVKEIGPLYRNVSGMNMKPGMAFLNLLHLGREKSLSGHCRVFTLCDWLANVSNDSLRVAHDTMAGSLGFMDIQRRKVSPELAAFLEDRTGLDCAFNEISEKLVPAGRWKSRDGKKIPIYTGVGDHPCAVLGAGNKPEETLSINIGTGSQVALIASKVKPESSTPAYEVRAFFDSAYLKTLTHIPAGRALNTYMGFLEEIARTANSDGDVWAWLKDLSVDEIFSSTLDVDLAVFRSAWNYKGSEGISNIEEGRFTLRNFLASLIRSFTHQYLEAIDILDPGAKVPRVILSGGIPQKLPQLESVFARLTHRSIKPAAAVDETFAGLHKLAIRS